MITTMTEEKANFFARLVSLQPDELTPFVYGNTSSNKVAGNKYFSVYETNILLWIRLLKNGKYECVPDFEASQLYTMVKVACEKNKLGPRFIFGTIPLTLSEVKELYDILPEYFKDYSGDKWIAKELSYDKDSLVNKAEDHNLEYNIKSLMEEIERIKREHESLPELMAQLDELNCKYLKQIERDGVKSD